MSSILWRPSKARHDPRSLPGVWRADESSRWVHPTIPSGHAALDAVLPGRGWPQGALCELLPARPAHPEWRLLRPALQVAAASGRIVLIRPPLEPNVMAFAALGVPPGQWLRVDAPSAAQGVWSAEQALRCPGVAAILLWLDAIAPEALRRLHLQALPARTVPETPVPAGTRALQAPLLFVIRPESAALAASPAPLRVQVASQGPSGLRVRVLKRRGSPLDHPVDLAAPLPVSRILWPSSPAQPRQRLDDVNSRNSPHDSPVDLLPACA